MGMVEDWKGGESLMTSFLDSLIFDVCFDALIFWLFNSRLWWWSGLNLHHPPLDCLLQIKARGNFSRRPFPLSTIFDSQYLGEKFVWIKWQINESAFNTHTRTKTSFIYPATIHKIKSALHGQQVGKLLHYMLFPSPQDNWRSWSRWKTSSWHD